MTSPSYYTPSNPSALDTIGYTKRVVDQLLRNNPLHNAAVESGLMRWLGNYTSDGGGAINFLWIGEFFPQDTNLPGNPPQKGFSLVRDDSRGGRSAVAMFDPNPGVGDGLKQALYLGGGDGQSLAAESRQGGWQFPEEGVPVYARDSDLALWSGTDAGAYSAIYEGRVSVVGRHVAYRVWDACTGGATGQFRLKVEAGGTQVLGAVHTLPANANGVTDGTVDVSALRGQTASIYWEAQRTNGVGKARASIISLRCYSAD